MNPTIYVLSAVQFVIISMGLVILQILFKLENGLEGMSLLARFIGAYGLCLMGIPVAYLVLARLAIPDQKSDRWLRSLQIFGCILTGLLAALFGFLVFQKLY